MPLQLPPKSWDTHTHCFEPGNFPFRTNRAYTPKPAKLASLLAACPAERIVLVQATIEDGFDGIVSNLRSCCLDSTSREVRAIILADPCLETLTDKEFEELHSIGIRGIRLHGFYGGSGESESWIKDHILRLAELYPVKVRGWIISAQLPLASWAALDDFWPHHQCLQNVAIIADHNGSAGPADLGSSNLASLVALLKNGNFYIKISALHRRSPSDAALMAPIVKLFAEAAPKSLLWGSDWPHVDTSHKGSDEAAFLPNVDVDGELELIRLWLSEEQWQDMLVTNPQRLFGD